MQAWAAPCGNGIVKKGEQCDDGNLAGGCRSPSFQIELRASNGECWGASFAAEDSKVDGGKLRARLAP